MTTLASGLSPARAVLPSGAVVLAQETSTTPAVTINAVFMTGSADDPPGLAGLAYLVARVIDRGTEHLSAADISEFLDHRGVSLRVSTGRHTMTLACTCLAEDFPDVLSLVAEIARWPVFPAAELDRRRAETITRIRQDAENPAVLAGDAVLQLLYGTEHPYSRPSKGRVETIEGIGRERLVEFHARHFSPEGLSLVVVGDVDPAMVQDRAEQAFEGWVGRSPRAIVVPAPPHQAVRTQRMIAVPGKSQADIAYGFTTISRLDPRYYAYWMMNTVLGQFGLGGRLADNIRERQGMAYYAFSMFDPNIGEGPLVVRAGVDPANVARALEAIDFEVRTFGAQGPTTEEMEETRDYLVGSIPRMLETNESIAAFLQNAEQFGLGLDFDRQLPGLLEAVTVDEVRNAAAEVLKPERAAVAVAGPPA